MNHWVESELRLRGKATCPLLLECDFLGRVLWMSNRARMVLRNPEHLSDAIIRRRLHRPRPVILEGVVALRILKAIGSPFGSGIPKLPFKELSPRVGSAWDLKGDGKDVVRASWGLFYLQALQESFWVRNRENQDVILITNTTADPAIGAGPLANFVYGVSRLPA